MEKGKSKEPSFVTPCLQNLDSHPNITKSAKTITKSPTFQSSMAYLEKRKPRSLVSLCFGVIGRNFEDIMEELPDVSASFPSDIRIALAAIARRRRLLNDDVITALVDNSWETLDISCSDVSDSGLANIVEICNGIRAVDISRCRNITSTGVSQLLQNCHSLEILRWGGCPRSESTARRCLNMLKPSLNYVEGESWEELDTTKIAQGAPSLRWLVWPNIDKDSLESLSTECPRILVNPKPSPLGIRGLEVPIEARQDLALDDPCVKDIDPATWAVAGFVHRPSPPSISSGTELSMAERFRLAFVERDNRLAPKRAKNARQHQRRAEREWVTMNTSAKALALASQASKSLNIRN